jgi:hypothetical protein
MTPRVTFIVPCYNYGRYVVQAIDSLLGQTFEALEVIVINDASPDDTAPVLARYADNPRVRVVHHEQNQGHLRTYNEGIAMARGEFIGILSADDYCTSPDALRRQVAVFDANPVVGMVYTGHLLVEEGGATTRVLPSPHDSVRVGLDEFRRLLWGNDVPHSGTLLRAAVQAELGPYDMRLPHTGDWDMWLRTAAKHDVGYIAEPLFAYRMHRKNMRHTAVRVQQAGDEGVLALERAFAALPESAPPDIWQMRDGAVSHALLQNVWFDLHMGWRWRAWQGIAYALRRRPSILAPGELWHLLPRLVLLTTIGHRGYRRLTDQAQRKRVRDMLSPA